MSDRPGRALQTLLIAAALQACASKPPPPPIEPDASSAVIADTATGGGPQGGIFFNVEQIDGKAISNSLSSSRSLSFGLGPNLRIASVARRVPAGKVTLQLSGRVAYAAPIQKLIASARDRLHAVSGSVVIELEPGKRYFANGVLDELRSEVWIEEAGTRRIIGNKIVGAPSAKALLAASAEPLFTCCNLHFAEDDANWISNANRIDKPFIPAGTPIKIYEVRKDRAKAMIPGAPMWLGVDYGPAPQVLPQFLAQVAIKADPAPRLASYPAPVQRAIRAGRIAIGMTREPLLMAIGYPAADRTASLDAPKWTYRVDDDVVYNVNWDAAGRVLAVDADAATRRLAMFAE